MIRIAFVGLHGPAFSGKDTALHILRALSTPTTRVIEARLAEPLYKMIRTRVPGAHSGMSKREKELPRRELGGLSIRQMAVAIGEGARKYDDYTWVSLWVNQIAQELQNGINHGVENFLVVVPDLRKAQELELFDQLGDAHILFAAGLSPVSLGTGSVLVHIEPKNAPVNDQVNAATETPLPFRMGRDLKVVNDHRAGLPLYILQLGEQLKHSPRVGKTLGGMAQLPDLKTPDHDLQKIASAVDELKQIEAYKWERLAHA